MIGSELELLDALDDLRRPPFEMAVLDALGRVGIVYADEDGVLGILRLAYEDDPTEPVRITDADFPLTRLVPADDLENAVKERDLALSRVAFAAAIVSGDASWADYAQARTDSSSGGVS